MCVANINMILVSLYYYYYKKFVYTDLQSVGCQMLGLTAHVLSGHKITVQEQLVNGTYSFCSEKLPL